MCVKYVATVVVVGVHQIITTVVDTLAVNVRINSASLVREKARRLANRCCSKD